MASSDARFRVHHDSDSGSNSRKIHIILYIITRKKWTGALAQQICVRVLNKEIRKQKIKKLCET